VEPEDDHEAAVRQVLNQLEVAVAGCFMFAVE
jgi:hypothetical protein